MSNLAVRPTLEPLLTKSQEVVILRVIGTSLLSIRRSWSAALAVALILGGSSGCGETVDVQNEDASPPTVKMDIHDLELGTGITDVTSDCCMLRRAIQPAKTLPILASGEDAQSGVTSLQVEAIVIRRCRGTDSFGIAREGLLEEKVVLARSAAEASTTTAPKTLAAGGNFRLQDHIDGECPPILVEDETGIHKRARQLLQFCGVRLSSTAQNGRQLTGSTKTVFIVPGQPESGSFPCPEVAF